MDDNRTELFEWCSLFMLASWGIVLLVPWQTFPTTPAYALLAEIASEENWGLLALAVSSTQFAGLTNNWYIFGYQLRVSSQFLTASLWLVVGILFFLGNPKGHAAAIYTLMGMFSLYTGILLMRRKRRPKNEDA